MSSFSNVLSLYSGSICHLLSVLVLNMSTNPLTLPLLNRGQLYWLISKEYNVMQKQMWCLSARWLSATESEEGRNVLWRKRGRDGMWLDQDTWVKSESAGRKASRWRELCKQFLEMEMDKTFWGTANKWNANKNLPRDTVGNPFI